MKNPKITLTIENLGQGQSRILMKVQKKRKVLALCETIHQSLDQYTVIDYAVEMMIRANADPECMEVLQ